MNNRIKQVFSLLFLLLLFSCKAPGGHETTYVLIKTTLGDIKVKLYDNTPIHRDNFIKLVKMGFYDGVAFHRVIKDFMIQAGDPSTKTGLTASQIDTLLTYTIPAEILPGNFHKKGALAAARQGNNVNPEMRSSGTQFYIVQGIKCSDQDLNATEPQINSAIRQSFFNKFIYEITDSALKNRTQLTEAEIQERASVKMFDFLSANKDFSFTSDQRDIYKNIGGVPRLDGTYTVFGEVVEGLETVDKIAVSPTNQSDKPLNDIRIIKMKIVNN